MFLFPAPGDSLYVFDAGNLRYSLHDPSGIFVRVLPRGAEAVTRPTWLYRRTVVESSTPGQSPAWALAVLDGVPDASPGDPFRRAKFDDLGFLWVTDSGSTCDWTVHTDSGDPIGALSPPPGVAFLQAGEDFILGLERDSVGREVVRAYSLTRAHLLRPRAPAPSFEPAAGDSLATSGAKDAVTAMMAALRQLITAQGAHYSEHATYTSLADSLAVAGGSGVEVVLMAADSRHCYGILYHRKSGTTCGTSVGFPAPPGWVNGSVFCGR